MAERPAPGTLTLPAPGGGLDTSHPLGASRRTPTAARTPAREELLRALALVVIADAVTLLVSVTLAWELRPVYDIWAKYPGEDAVLAAGAGPWVALAWLLMLASQGAYSTRDFGVGPDEFRKVFIGSVITGAGVTTFCYLVQLPLSRGFVLLSFLVGTPLLLVERYVVRRVVHRLRIRGHLVNRVLAVGGPADIEEVTAALERESYVGYRMVGACLPDGADVAEHSLSVPVLGTVADTYRICREVGADTVLVARSGGFSSSRDLRRVAWKLEGTAIDLVVVPSLTDVAGPRIHMRPVAGLPLLHVEQPTTGEAGGWGKRVFDVVLASLALLALSPLLLVVAAMVKLHDGGPVLFRQRRIGRAGEAFEMLKFRSMVVDAEALEAGMRAEQGHEGALWKMAEDPRVTRFGRFIRRYSIDELPQFFNVVQGKMSLVGPRPQQAWEVDGYAEDTRRRLLVRPGLTGLWQVSGRSSLSWADAERLDLYYVDNWSMTTDLLIIAKTAKAVLTSAGAY